MKNFTISKRLLSVLVLIIATIALLVYARMESISVAHNENETLTEVNLSKYVNYDEAWGKGTILQYDVKTGIEYGEDKEQSPIKNTTLMAVAPQINGVYPDRATVVSKSTKSTNGKEVNSEINYSYDATVGTVTVQASNESQDGTAINGTTDQNARDEYVVIFNYGEAAYDGENTQKDLEMQLSVIQNLFADENNIAQTSSSYKASVAENIGNVVTLDETSSDIYNGNVKSNVINGTDYATTFTENDEISIANKDAQDKLTVTINPTFVKEYQDRNGETKQEDLGNNGNLVYKSTRIEKSNILNVLGEDGTLEIQDVDGNTLATINKDTEYAEDGTVTINYETEPQSLVVKASNIANEGELKLASTKEIKSSMRDTDNIKIKIASQIVGTRTETITVEPEQAATLTTSNAEQSVEEAENNTEDQNCTSKENAQTTNEATEDNTNDANKEEVNNTNSEEATANENEETQNSNENVENADNSQNDVTANQATTQEVETQSYVLNNEAQIEIKQAQTNINVNINNSDWTNEKQNDAEFDIILNSSSEKDNMFKNPTIRIELPNEVEKVVLGDSSILYANGLELANVTTETNENGNIVIIATIQGTQTAYNNSDLGLQTTIKIPATIILKKDIETKATNVNINYTNEYVTGKNAEEGQFIAEVKVNNYQEDLAAEQEEQETQNEIYAEADQNTNDATVELDAALSQSLKLEVAPAKGNGEVIKDGGTVYENEYIKYNIKVTNTSDQDIDNLKIKATIPEGLTYGELQADYTKTYGEYKYNFEDQTREKELNIGTIKAGEDTTLYYEVKANDLADGETSKFVETDIVLYAGNKAGQQYKTTFNIEPANMNAFLGGYIPFGGTFDYWINLYSNEDKEITIKLKFPEQFNLSEATYIEEGLIDNPEAPGSGIDVYNEENNINNAELVKNDGNVVTLKVKTNHGYYFRGSMNTEQKVSSNKSDESMIEMIAYAEMLDGNTTYTSNENRYDIHYNSIEATMTSDKEGEELNFGDEVNYQITVKNTGKTNIKQNENMPNYVAVNVSDFLPENVKPEKAIYNTWEVVEEGENKTLQEKENVESDLSDSSNLSITLLIPEGQSSIINVKTTAGVVSEKTMIENNATASGDDLETKVTNTVEHTILPPKEEIEPADDDDNNTVEPGMENDDSDDDDNYDDNNNSNVTPGGTNNNNSQNTNEKMTISGLAWVDKNEDGQRQSDEQTLSDVSAILINAQTSSQVQTQTTTNSGTYSFTNIDQGEYLVAFKYDTVKYKLTNYQVSGADESKNSDAISKSIAIDGKQEDVGITDTISSSASNVDIGLIETKPCDIEVNKYVSKITVKTNKGTKNYDYNNKNMAKVEIRAKELEGATVVINYKLAIKNVGEEAGRIGKVVDTLPQGLDFSSNLNKTWVKGNDGTLTNDTLSNKMLSSNETAELSLIATKQMTANATGLFTNKAELQDITSAENAGDSNVENNSSSADVIISVSTGAVLYITFAIIALAALIIALYILNKKGKIHFNFKKPNWMKFKHNENKVKNKKPRKKLNMKKIKIKVPKAKTFLGILALAIVTVSMIGNGNVEAKNYWSEPSSKNGGAWSEEEKTVYETDDKKDPWHNGYRNNQSISYTGYPSGHPSTWLEDIGQYTHTFTISGPAGGGTCGKHSGDRMVWNWSMEKRCERGKSFVERGNRRV